MLLFVIQAEFENRVNHGSGSIIGGCQQPGHPVVYRPHSPGAAVSSGAWHSVRIIARGDSLVVSLIGTLAGRVAVPYSAGFPTAGYVGLGTGDFEDFVLFNDLSLNARASTCTGLPLEGAQAFVEQCAASSAGQSFNFVAGPSPPAGQFQLAANASLCLEQNATGSPTQFVFLRVCDATNLRQLWNIETSIEDGPFLTGPVTCAANRGVMDVYYSNYADDTPIDTYTWEEQASGARVFTEQLSRRGQGADPLSTRTRAPPNPAGQPGPLLRRARGPAAVRAVRRLPRRVCAAVRLRAHLPPPASLRAGAPAPAP